jgi:hypothetical protein
MTGKARMSRPRSNTARSTSSGTSLPSTMTLQLILDRSVKHPSTSLIHLSSFTDTTAREVLGQRKCPYTLQSMFLYLISLGKDGQRKTTRLTRSSTRSKNVLARTNRSTSLSLVTTQRLSARQRTRRGILLSCLMQLSDAIKELDKIMRKAGITSYLFGL